MIETINKYAFIKNEYVCSLPSSESQGWEWECSLASLCIPDLFQNSRQNLELFSGGNPSDPSERNTKAKLSRGHSAQRCGAGFTEEQQVLPVNVFSEGLAVKPLCLSGAAKATPGCSRDRKQFRE